MNELTNAVPSASALMSAAARAAHELVDQPPHLLIDHDALAVCALFEPSPLDFQLEYPHQPVLAAARASAVIRSAFAQRVLTEVEFDQCVLLGAGLDSSAYQTWAGPERTVWLVDRPEVLAWRTALFAEAGLADDGVPVPANLGDDPLVDRLADAGLNLRRPAVVLSLGLSMYLSRQQNRDLFAQLAALAPGSEMVLDTLLPNHLADSTGRAYAEALTAGLGPEPWTCRPSPDQVHRWIDAAGWQVVAQVAETDAVAQEFWQANPGLTPMGLVQLTRARRSRG